MITHAEITGRQENGLFIITLKALQNRMGLSGLIDELEETCAYIAADNSVNVVLVIGEADAFNLGNMQAYPFPVDSVTCRNISLANPLASLDCPVIIGVSGRVTGQGLEMILAGDIRLAAEGSSFFSMPQLCTGMIPFDGGTQRLSRVVGKAKALEMVLTGQTIDGQEARRIGLVNMLAPAAELLTSAMEMARKMARQAPLALRYAKEAVGQGMEMNINQGLRLEADLYFLLHTTRDRLEGIKAFRGKRKPIFEGS